MMFKKEAEERARKLEESQTLGVYDSDEDFERDRGWNEGEVVGYEEGFKDGAEFGYNKANEWHYVNWKYLADKDYPESETASYLVRLRNKDTLICEWETEEGFGCFYDANLEPIDNDDVYAWKEIVLPELLKEVDK